MKKKKKKKLLSLRESVHLEFPFSLMASLSRRGLDPTTLAAIITTAVSSFLLSGAPFRLDGENRMEINAERFSP